TVVKLFRVDIAIKRFIRFHHHVHRMFSSQICLLKLLKSSSLSVIHSKCRSTKRSIQEGFFRLSRLPQNLPSWRFYIPKMKNRIVNPMEIPGDSFSIKKIPGKKTKLDPSGDKQTPRGPKGNKNTKTMKINKKPRMMKKSDGKKTQSNNESSGSLARAITYGCATHMAEDSLGDGVVLMGPLRTCLLQTLFRPLELLPILSASSGDNLNLMKNDER
ncbi:hypothetical protein DAPPUDRAFT_122983, partial [Daphnia pulex]